MENPSISGFQDLLQALNKIKVKSISRDGSGKEACPFLTGLEKESPYLKETAWESWKRLTVQTGVITRSWQEKEVMSSVQTGTCCSKHYLYQFVSRWTQLEQH
jgi:hypothetical protein